MIAPNSAAGYYAAPATGATAGNLVSYAFSNAADIGKAFISYR